MTESPHVPTIVDPHGHPARQTVTRDCPRCGATPDRRLPSGGYGELVHDICGTCGHDFEERTV